MMKLGACLIASAAVGLAGAASHAQTVDLSAPAQNAEVEVSEPRQTFDVVTAGWACGEPISDETIFDSADMAEYVQRFEAYEVNLRGLASFKRQFSEDRTLGEQVLNETAERTLGQPFSDIDRKASRLASRYETEATITPEDAASFFKLNLAGKSSSGVIGARNRHPHLIARYKGLAPGSTEHEFGRCYDASVLVAHLAELSRQAADLRAILTTVRELRVNLVPPGGA